MFRLGARCLTPTSPHHSVSPKRSFGVSVLAQNYYKDLGLDHDAGSSEIKKAYYDLSKKFHPDVNPGDPEALKRFHQISKAYKVLGDPRQRRRYDRGSLGKDGGSVADDEALKHKFKGEEFFKSRSDLKDKYSSRSGEYSRIQSKKTSGINRRMDDYVIGLRSKAFKSNMQYKKDSEYMASKHEEAATKTKRTVTSPYVGRQPPQSNNGGGGSVAPIIIFLVTLLAMSRIMG